MGSKVFLRNRLCWCSLLDSLIFSGLLRFAGLDASGPPSLWYRLLVRGCWNVDLGTMLAVDPYVNLKTILYPTDALSSSFL
ncbi:hypothetical protein MtrunA17_Chr2g0305151 [Medicago truncatula]|uniref:Uncharacterized protein n=1 Tax=Medicago truncatula TaxID=3880 RepID=A0A396J767_MEDTR|nr:hypothetical protein MtrunA17_Chr2g0305151 [Medicago truncatula]